jgi:uncharacterized protein YdeI (YjbR/CyaY-like superfamily)
LEEPPRNPRSTWSRTNRRRAAKMTELGLMTEHGQALIELARAKGTWQALPDEAGTVVPDDLRELLDLDQAAHENFERFPPSSKRLILEWIAAAKRPDTRGRRIDRTVTLAAMNIRANHPGVRIRDAGDSRGLQSPGGAQDAAVAVINQMPAGSP